MMITHELQGKTHEPPDNTHKLQVNSGWLQMNYRVSHMGYGVTLLNSDAHSKGFCVCVNESVCVLIVVDFINPDYQTRNVLTYSL